ncbi:MAG: DUF6261 family protein [Bacteroidales bacterium]|jgi:hypothetical protein|nr:DUF6261 family protein [Bacteroidales bacterium]
MQEVITRINLQHLKNETHVQFNESANALFVKYNPQTLGIAPLHALFKTAFDREIAALDFMRKSEITAQIFEQDRVRDAVFRGFSDTVKGAIRHFDPAWSEAAERLHNLFRHYGNIAQKTFDDETAAINDLLRELQEKSFATAITLLGLTPWQEKLREENDRFAQLMMDRYRETAQKTPYRMTAARRDTDKYYHAIIGQLENISLAATADISELVRELNAVTDRFKSILAQERGERKRKSEN